MLELIQITKNAPVAKGSPAHLLLDGVTLTCPGGQLLALVGPPRSGKTTLLNILARIQRMDRGAIVVRGETGELPPLHPNQIGLVPANDSALHPHLTVTETLVSAGHLRLGSASPHVLAEKAAQLIATLGLQPVADQQVCQLTLAQCRRLLLGTALVSDPLIVLCDEWLNGLDAKSERELLATLKWVARDQPGRVVIHASRALSQLHAFDTVALLYEGQVCFHGPARALPHYLTVDNLDDTYPRLAMRPVSRWSGSWSRHRDSYYEAFKISPPRPARDSGGVSGKIRLPKETAPPDANDEPPPPARDDAADTSGAPTQSSAKAAVFLPLPSFAAQARHILQRRFLLLRRHPREWILQSLSLLGFPLLAMLLIWSNRIHLSPDADLSQPNRLWPAAFTCLMAAFVQVLMLIFMSVRNGAREIAGERSPYERERNAGLRPGAYLLGKVLYVTPIAVLQALVLGIFTRLTTGGLPGPFGLHLFLLVLTTVAFSLLCLAISCHAKTSNRAQSLCYTLAFAQVFLTGALLGLPRVIGGIVSPFITAYYGWAGIMNSLADHPVFIPMTGLVRTWFAPPSLAISALACHLTIGLLVGYCGLRRRLR